MVTHFLRPGHADRTGRLRDSVRGLTAARHGGRPVALATLLVVLFLTFLDNMIVAVALGSVQSDLHAGVTSLQWVVSA